MSVWLGGAILYGRVYGTLNRIYNATNNDEKTLRRHMVESFPGIQWQGAADPVKELCVKLWRLNAKAYSTRYGEMHRITQQHVALMLKEASEANDIQLFKDIGYIEYQCSEDATDNTRLFKQLGEFESRIAVAILLKSSEYNRAEWG
jgi:hypothetical protein